MGVRHHAAVSRVGGWFRSVRPERATIKGDVLAGLPGAIGSVPDGMAAAALAGVNPVFGLYSGALGPIAGGLTAHTRLMVITTTSAAALAAGSALSGVPEADKPSALVLLTVVAGAAMVAASVLRLGRFTRFVSHSVMIGFLTGIAINILLGQLPDLLGVDAEGSTSAAKALDVVRHLDEADLATALTGLGAFVLVAGLARTRARIVGAVAALAIPTVVVMVAGLDGVGRVSDAGAIRWDSRRRGSPSSDCCRPRWPAGRSPSPPSSWSRERVSLSRHRTPTDRRPTLTATSLRRASATWRQGCSRGCPSEARSGRRL